AKARTNGIAAVMLSFDKPVCLVLLALIPIILLLAYRSLAGLGTIRRVLALGLRGMVLALMVFALAEAQWEQTSDKLTVVYLLDQSISIPEEQRRTMAEFV